MAHAVEANLFAFFQHLAPWPRVEWHEDQTCWWALSHLPYPLFNSVLHARLRPADAEAAIEARIRACESRGVPMLWWTGPSTTPADMGDILTRRGFLAEPAFGMAADLRAIDLANRLDPHVTIAAVTDDGTLALWCRVLCQAFGAPPAFAGAFAELALAIGLGPSSPFKHFLGFWKDEPVATCSLFVGAGVAGIYDVGTLPERRRRGIGTAVTRAALADARASGLDMAILHSSALGAGVYRRLGFTDVCDIGQYVWLPEALRR